MQAAGFGIPDFKGLMCGNLADGGVRSVYRSNSRLQIVTQ